MRPRPDLVKLPDYAANKRRKERRDNETPYGSFRAETAANLTAAGNMRRGAAENPDLWGRDWRLTGNHTRKMGQAKKARLKAKEHGEKLPEAVDEATVAAAGGESPHGGKKKPYHPGPGKAAEVYYHTRASNARHNYNHAKSHEKKYSKSSDDSDNQKRIHRDALRKAKAFRQSHHGKIPEGIDEAGTFRDDESWRDKIRREKRSKIVKSGGSRGQAAAGQDIAGSLRRDARKSSPDSPYFAAKTGDARYVLNYARKHRIKAKQSGQKLPESWTADVTDVSGPAKRKYRSNMRKAVQKSGGWRAAHARALKGASYEKDMANVEFDPDYHSGNRYDLSHDYLAGAGMLRKAGKKAGSQKLPEEAPVEESKNRSTRHRKDHEDAATNISGGDRGWAAKAQKGAADSRKNIQSAKAAGEPGKGDLDGHRKDHKRRVRNIKSRIASAKKTQKLPESVDEGKTNFSPKKSGQKLPESSEIHEGGKKLVNDYHARITPKGEVEVWSGKGRPNWTSRGYSASMADGAGAIRRGQKSASPALKKIHKELLRRAKAHRTNPRAQKLPEETDSTENS